MVKEAVRVTEAVILGTMLESYNSVPAFMRTLISSGNPSGPFTMSVAEQESMMELRSQVFRIWELLRSSQNFDPALLQPILQVRTISQYNVQIKLLIVVLISQVFQFFTYQETGLECQFS